MRLRAYLIATVGGLLACHALPAAQAQTAQPEAMRKDAAGQGGSKNQDAMHSNRVRFVEFSNSPFPYRGEIPGDGKPFLDATLGDRRGHTSPRGGIHWEDRTYSDRHAMLFIPASFDIRKPAVIVVYFHGNKATLERDVRGRQQVPRQLAESHLNAILVAPQFAVDALDSSAGNFWRPDMFALFLGEAAAHLAEAYGDTSAEAAFAKMPVILVAYSGGYLPAAFSLVGGGADERIRGVILLDGLYGEVERFASWVTKHATSAFFFSAFSKSSSAQNALLQRLLADKHVGFQSGLPQKLSAGRIAFLPVGGDVVHNDFVTQAWIKDPLKAALMRVVEFSRDSSRSDPGTVALDGRRDEGAVTEPLRSDKNRAAASVLPSNDKASTPPDLTSRQTSDKSATANVPQSGAGMGSIGIFDRFSATSEGRVAPPPTGDFSVQLASMTSEQDARDTSARVQIKCSQALAPYRPIIQEMDVQGTTRFRVRVENLSQKDAKNLCDRLKSAGCECVVPTNW